MNNKYAAPILLKLFLISGMARAQTPAPAAMGKELFEQKGVLACVYCHGVDGDNGKVAVAAKLSMPKAWKAWKALGGDAAFAADRKAFLSKLEEATMDLMISGAIKHNATYKKDAFNWGKIQTYDGQMVGLTGSSSAGWLAKNKDKGVTKESAAAAVYLYVQSFDKQGVFR